MGSDCISGDDCEPPPESDPEAEAQRIELERRAEDRLDELVADCDDDLTVP
jgi:hypothetical protein